MRYYSKRDRQHAKLREIIQGQNVTIPSLYRLRPDWNPEIHQDYQKAREESLNPWLQR